MIEVESDNSNLFYLDNVESWEHKETDDEFFGNSPDNTLVLLEITGAAPAPGVIDAALRDAFALYSELLAIQGPGGRRVDGWCWRAAPALPCEATSPFASLGITNSSELQGSLASGELVAAFVQSGSLVHRPGVGRCLQLLFMYAPGRDGNDREFIAWRADWEAAANRKVQAFRSGVLTVTCLNRQLSIEETAKLTTDSMPLMVLAVVMIVAVVACLLSGRPPVRSRILLACTSVVSVILSVVCAYGFIGFFGVKSNATMVLMGFVLLGIGVDDMIIIVRHTDSEGEAPLAERIPRGLQRAGLAITVTSVTSAAAFASATQAPLGMAKTFCTFGLVAILADFFIQATFFEGLLVYDERRREADRPECLCCLRCAAGRPQPGPVQGTDRVAPVFKRFGEALVTRRGVALSLLTWAALLIASTSQIRNISTKFDVKDYYPADSPLVLALDMSNTYFNGTSLDLFVYIWHRGDLHGRFLLEGELAALDATVEALVRLDWIDYAALGREQTDWTVAFRTWIAGVGGSWHGAPFDRQVDAFLNHPPFPPAGSNLTTCLPPWCINPSSFRGMLALDGDGLPVLSKISLPISFPIGGPSAIHRTNDAKRIVRETLGPLEGFVYSFGFLAAERDEIFPVVILRTLGITCAIVVAVLVVFLDLFVGIFAGVCVALVDASILGCMAALGEPMTIVMFLNLTMVVGMCVDYIVHSAHEVLRELNAGKTPGDAVVDTMKNMGRCIFDGAVSSLLGLTIPGLLASSAAAKSFGRTICLAIVFGMVYGLVWGPTLLYVLASLPRCPLGRASVTKPVPFAEGNASAAVTNFDSDTEIPGVPRRTPIVEVVEDIDEATARYTTDTSVVDVVGNS